MPPPQGREWSTKICAFCELGPSAKPKPLHELYAPNVWNLYKIIHEILMIVVSPVVNTGVHEYLTALVQAHHEGYIEFFGALKPKHHFLLHYPKMLELYGPLLPLSALKSERNHRRGKVYAPACHSRIDFAYSSIVKYQLILCDRLLRINNNPQLLYTKITRVRVQSLPNHECFVHLFPNQDHVEIVNAATVWGTLYTVEMILVLEVQDLFPVFGKILYIMLYNGNVAFIFRRLTTIAYREHICSYVVGDTNSLGFVLQNELVSHSPLWQRIATDDGRNVVCLRHSL